MLDGVVIVDFRRYGNGVVVNHTGECLCLGEMVLGYLRVKGQIVPYLGKRELYISGYKEMKKLNRPGKILAVDESR